MWNDTVAVPKISFTFSHLHPQELGHSSSPCSICLKWLHLVHMPHWFPYSRLIICCLLSSNSSPR
uniref:Ovule protein n=1 Tax=Ascaris lumbricoides TaxID=6252 RepID=A0A0M3IIL6_ASCLU